MAINQLVIPYPDFQNLQVIDPDKFDQNNAAIIAKCDEISAFCNTVDITTFYTKTEADLLFANKANIWQVVDLTNNQTINGNKVFIGDISVVEPNFAYNPTTKFYVDNAVTSLLSGIAPAGSITDDKLSNTSGQIKDRVSEIESTITSLEPTIINNVNKITATITYLNYTNIGGGL